MLVAEFAEVLRESFYAEETSLEDVWYEVRRVLGLLDEDPETQDLEWMVKRAMMLTE